jgi:hypothetical protein
MRNLKSRRRVSHCVLASFAIFALISSCAAAMAHDMSTTNAGALMDMGHQMDMGKMTPGKIEAMPDHGAMAAHLAWSHPRPVTDADKQKAQQILETLRSALAKYKDYHVAKRDGFKPFHTELKQPIVHFTRRWYAVKAAFVFNPAQPTSLLYKRTPDGGYELVGAMYTASKHASEDRLNDRVPLSIARWHRHINLCFPPRGTDLATIDWTRFGPKGSIATKAECDAAGGRFYPQLFGWMVHVYPWEKDPSKVWGM